MHAPQATTAVDYWATCQSSLSAHSFFLRVNKTSATSLDPLPDRQLFVSVSSYMSPQTEEEEKKKKKRRGGEEKKEKKKGRTHITISWSFGKVFANCIPPHKPCELSKAGIIPSSSVTILNAFKHSKSSATMYSALPVWWR
jgi:hypothetical protein